MAKITAKLGDTEFDFITLKGEPLSLGRQTEEISRGGVDGHAFRQAAKRTPPFEMIGIRDFDDGAALDLFYTDMVAKLQGQLCSFEDDFGTTNGSFNGDPYTVMCLQVRPLKRTPTKTAVGGLSTNKKYLAVFAITLQLTVPPL